MTATSHRIFNLSAAIALSFHWWVWLLFFLAASLPDQLEPAIRKRARFRSHRGLFHTYSVWILLGLTIFWLPTAPLTVSGIPLFDAGVKVLVWIYLAGVLCHLLADTGSRQGCSILLPCDCGQLGYCRCHWYTRRLSFKWYRTGEFSETVCLFLFCGLCAGDCGLAVEEPFGFCLISRSLRSHPAEQAYDAITEEQGASSRLP